MVIKLFDPEVVKENIRRWLASGSLSRNEQAQIIAENHDIATRLHDVGLVVDQRLLKLAPSVYCK